MGFLLHLAVGVGIYYAPFGMNRISLRFWHRRLGIGMINAITTKYYQLLSQNPPDAPWGELVELLIGSILAFLCSVSCTRRVLGFL